MKRSTSPKITFDLILVVLFIGISWFIRIQLLVEKSLTFRTADLLGFLSDLGIAAGFALIALNLVRFGRWPLIFPVLVWAVANIIIYEFTSFFDANDAIRHAGFLGDATFFQGSAANISNIFVVAAVAVGSVVAIWVQKRRPPTYPALGLLGLLSVVGIVCHFVLPTSIEVDSWRQENFFYSNFLPASEATEARVEVVALTPEMEKLFKPDLDGKSKLIGPAPEKKPNVLLVILESVSGAHLPKVAKYHGATYDIRMRHLNTLVRDNFSFANFVTNQRKTNRGEYALLCGDYPKLNPEEAKMTEFVRGGDRVCLPQVLQENGYETVYLQAAPTAFMLKDRFMNKIGYERVHGDEYFDRNSYRHTPWGVDDAGFFEESAKLVRELNEKEDPWFLTLLNVGTHHPFDVPDSFKSPGPQDDQSRAFRYADVAINKFIRSLQADGELDDTLVILTTDESIGYRQGYTDLDRALSQSWGFLTAFGPRIPKSWVLEPYGQTDVSLSILDYLEIADKAPHFIGRSLFRHYAEPRPVFFGNVYSAKMYRADPDGVLTRCTRGFEKCSATQYTPGKIFERNQKLTTLSSDRVTELKGVVGRSAQSKFDSRREQTLELVATQRMELAETNHEQVLFGGQYLYIPKNTRVDVDVEIELEGDADAVAGFDLIVKGNKYFLLNRPLPILRTGEKMRLKYTRYVSTDRDRFEARFYARHMNPGSKAVVKFKETKMKLKPTEHTVGRGSNVIRELKVFRVPMTERVDLSIEHPLQFRGKPCGNYYKKEWVFSSCGEQVVLYGPYLPVPKGTTVTFDVEVEGLSGEVELVADMSSGIGRFDYAASEPVRLKRGQKHTFSLKYVTEKDIDDFETRVRAKSLARYERFKIVSAKATFTPKK